MKIIELTSSEDRLHLYSFLEASKENVLARNCFYISHKKHYPEFKKVLFDSIRAIERFSPSIHDLVLIDRSSEAGSKFDREQASALNDFSIRAGVPLKNIVFVSQSSYLDELRNSFGLVGGGAPSWVPFHHFLYRISNYYSRVSLDDFGYRELEAYDPKFLCTNNKVRAHRKVLLEYLIASDKIRDFKFSYHGKDLFNVESTYELFRERHFPSMSGFISKNLNEEIFRRRLPSPFVDDVASENFIDGFPERQVRKSIVTLVCESDMSPAFSRVTEKSIKPFIYHRPQLVWGTMGSLSILRDFGFRSYSNVIDESYDRIANPEDRLLRIVGELDRLAKELINKDKRKEFIDKTMDACRFNQNFVKTGGLIDRIENEALSAFNFIIRRSSCLHSSRA